jgi:hypothetical protein
VVRMREERKPKQFLEARPEWRRPKRKAEKELWGWNRRDWEKEGKKLKRDEAACCRPRKMEGVRRAPTPQRCEAPWGRVLRFSVSASFHRDYPYSYFISSRYVRISKT